MILNGGHGGGAGWEQGFWVWGIPESGDVSIVYEWPAESVPESRFTIDGEALRSASERAVILWDEPEPEPEPELETGDGAGVEG